MKLNEKKFFAFAKEYGIEAADITSNESSSLSVSVFHSEVDSLTNNSSYQPATVGKPGMIPYRITSNTAQEARKA